MASVYAGKHILLLGRFHQFVPTLPGKGANRYRDFPVMRRKMEEDCLPLHAATGRGGQDASGEKVPPWSGTVKQPYTYKGSASSINMIGMSSRIGYRSRSSSQISDSGSAS